MLPGQYSASLYVGDSWGIVVKPISSSGAALDLTGWTAAAQVRTKPDSTEILVSMAVVVGTNTISVSMSPDDTALLSGAVAWDLETVNATGIVRTLLAGTLTMVGDVTRLGA